jgi:hypothetical protein
MKNIHVLPTSKPSRLVLSDNSILTIIEESNYNLSHIKSVHAYITADEEIKEGDWFVLDMSDNDRPDELHQMGTNKWSKTGGINFSETTAWTICCKKVILTTNSHLIKNGVQAIDDEFLEWFVKNPECEFVEVRKKPLDSHFEFFEYKIIIPQGKPKQETLEEAAERYVENYKWEEEQDPWFDFMEGAKWQAERMYSEEEVKQAYLDGCKIGLDNSYHVNKWFKQFKKK